MCPVNKCTFITVPGNACCEGVETLGSPAVDDVMKADIAEQTAEEKCLSCYGAETAEMP